MNHNSFNCSKCGRLTPERHPKCVYCGTPAAGGGNGASMHEEPRLLGGAKPRFQRQSDDKVHVLVAPTRDPIELDGGKLFVIGRDLRASLVVNLPDVSRQHAEIDWKGESDSPRPVLCEIRSVHGTFLNGKRVQRDDPQPLRSGDEIRLGDSFTLYYLHLTERDLRLELEGRGKDDTREVPRPRPGGATGGSRGAPTMTTEAAAPPADDAVGDLVAAALGEADASSFEAEGDFARVHGRVLVKRLYAQRRTGVLTVFDGTTVGEMVLMEGRCRHAILGVLTGREALEQVARLDYGRYRFCPYDADDLAHAPPPAEVDENGLALAGDFGSLPGSELIKDFIQQRASGVLTVFTPEGTGQVVLDQGICQQASFGTKVDREALADVVRLTRGHYRFRPMPRGAAPGARNASAQVAPGTGAHRRRPPPPLSGGRRADGYAGGYEGYEGADDQGYADAGYGYDDGYPAPRRPSSGRAPAVRPGPSGPLKAPDSDDGVLRRSSTPMRAPPPSHPAPASQAPPPGAPGTPARWTRRPPPPPPRRRAPPPPPRPY